jgi:predicted dinucleotide-binding enzyme
VEVLIVGAGNMGRAVATRALAGGHRVRIADREPERARAVVEELDGDVAAVELDGPGRADVVVLAVPYPADREIAARWADALAGTTVVDVTNPVDFSTLDDLVTPPGTSAAEQVARAAPRARVVKAFNTTFAGNLAGDRPLDVFIAADDDLAAAHVATLAADGGLRPIRVGGLKHARALEAFQLLHMKVQDQIGGRFRTSLTMQPV